MCVSEGGKEQGNEVNMLSFPRHGFGSVDTDLTVEVSASPAAVCGGIMPAWLSCSSQLSTTQHTTTSCVS